MEQILMFLKPMIEAYAGNYGWAIQIVAIIGSLKVVMTPVMTAIKAVTEATYWTTKDDDFYKKVIESKAYKTFNYVLGWVASIDLPKKKKK